jgi:membrane-associated protease RseP (regulator of RpoE activity)
MLGRVFAIALFGAVPILGSGCPCCSSAADETKTVQRAALGAETRVPTGDEAKAYQLDKLVGKIQGQYIIAVEKDGPAAKAGLKAGDVLLALDANKVFSRDEIDDLLRVSTPGSKVKALVKRADTHKEENVTVALGATKPKLAVRFRRYSYAAKPLQLFLPSICSQEYFPTLLGIPGHRPTISA